MSESCALDFAEDRGPATLENVGDVMNLTRERARQIEVKTLLKMRMRIPNGKAIMEHIANVAVERLCVLHRPNED